MNNSVWEACYTCKKKTKYWQYEHVEMIHVLKTKYQLEKTINIQGVSEIMVQTSGGDYLHQNKIKVSLKKFRNLISFGDTSTESHGGIITNDVISRHKRGRPSKSHSK